ncbi:MAG: hypothetical protein H6Q90_4449 [Deltaproteobacteria bacterium]|nr:hypothetical protein [Deltaproteobacteria bacterium]
MRPWILALVLAACAPTVDGPVERQRAADLADGDQLAAQLAALPGVVQAKVLLRHAARDPLATTAPSPAGASLVVIVDDQADRVAVADAARQLANAAAPELAPTIIVEVGASRPTLAKVGPFTVEAASKGPLRAVLGISLAVIAVLAGWIAWRERRGQRRGNSAQ